MASNPRNEHAMAAMIKNTRSTTSTVEQKVYKARVTSAKANSAAIELSDSFVILCSVSAVQLGMNFYNYNRQLSRKWTEQDIFPLALPHTSVPIVRFQPSGSVNKVVRYTVCTVLG